MANTTFDHLASLGDRVTIQTRNHKQQVREDSGVVHSITYFAAVDSRGVHYGGVGYVVRLDRKTKTGNTIDVKKGERDIVAVYPSSTTCSTSKQHH